ncbi:hypothetical protein [Microbacterium sp. 8M]|uniref:hypothetical protein n=1 Tax=Microbacterium sp. 8M TaxID=2653153 RepID=UPI001356A1C7|nr:hypothetical protein [Microbacterium sp. 8M]
MDPCPAGIPAVGAPTRSAASGVSTSALPTSDTAEIFDTGTASEASSALRFSSSVRSIIGRGVSATSRERLRSVVRTGAASFSATAVSSTHGTRGAMEPELSVPFRDRDARAWSARSAPSAPSPDDRVARVRGRGGAVRVSGAKPEAGTAVSAAMARSSRSISARIRPSSGLDGVRCGPVDGGGAPGPSPFGGTTGMTSGRRAMPSSPAAVRAIASRPCATAARPRASVPDESESAFAAMRVSSTRRR